MGQRRAKRNSPTRNPPTDLKETKGSQGKITTRRGGQGICLVDPYAVEPGTYGMTREEYYRQVEKKESQHHARHGNGA